MITLSINGVNRTSKIVKDSLRITDNVNQANDTASFAVRQYGAETYRPNLGEEVLVEADSDLIYGGVIVQIDQEMEGHSTILYRVTCKDFTQFLDRQMVTERYENETLQDIILDLIDRYADDYGFTGTNVGGADIEVASISFNEIPMSECLTKLAKLVNYFWYVDFEKDVHFFKKNDEPAPFNLSDTSDNFIFDSLAIREDLTQIRNKVKIRGGEAEAEVRTEQYAGNGEQTVFPLGNKYAAEPTIEVDGVEVTVGVDFLSQDADYDVMWNYQQKYIRFTAGNIPGAPGGGDTTNITITGIPLKPIVVERINAPSIAQYGVYEYREYNDSIKTRDEALQYAQSQLSSYANALRNGSFQTYTPGLRSGQTIDIVSTIRGINEKFVIQSVTFVQLTPDNYQWNVEVATLKNVSLIDVLQRMLLEERIAVGEDETLLNFFSMDDGFSMDDELTDISVTTTEDYVWEQGDPGSDSYSNPIIWNKFTWE